MHVTVNKGEILVHRVGARQYLQLQKLIPRLKYNKLDKICTTKYDRTILSTLEKYGCAIPEYARWGVSLQVYMDKKYLESRVPKQIAKGLFPYQVEGVRKLMAGFGLLADVMGLGKTITAIGFLKYEHKRRSIVICPAFLKEKWAYEIRKWSDFPVTTVYGTQSIDYTRRGVYVINYDILQYHQHSIQKRRIDVAIADEFHLCKNDGANRTRAVRLVAKNSTRFIALTGTPILNNAIDLYPALNLIDPFQFYSRTLFEQEYAVKRDKRVVGTKNHDQLYSLLQKSIMIRRTYEEVRKQFGYKTQVVQELIPIRLVSYEEYDKADRDINGYLYNTTGKVYGESAIMQKPRVLKEIIYENKKGHIFDWLNNFLLEGEKITLFFTRTKHLKEFAERYSAQTIFGETPTNKRLDIVNDFNVNNQLVLCCNIKAAGVGLDIVGCHNVGFIDLDDVWENMNQAIKRFDRIGQVAPTVNVYYFLGLQTIEDSGIIKKLDNKHETAKKVIDGRELRRHERLKRR